MKHHARLDKRVKPDEPWTQRHHLEQAARRGVASAVKLLEGPPFPEELGYLHEWLIELHGRSGVTMSGLAPLTYTTIESWGRLCGIELEPREVQALMLLDSAMLFPGEEEDDHGPRHTRHPD